MRTMQQIILSSCNSQESPPNSHWRKATEMHQLQLFNYNIKIFEEAYAFSYWRETLCMCTMQQIIQSKFKSFKAPLNS